LNRKELLEHYKSIYYYELENKNHVSSRVQSVSAVLVLVFTLTIYMVRTFDYTTATPNLIAIFWVFIAVYALLTVSVIVFLFLAYWGNIFRAVSPPNAIEEHREKYDQYTKDYYSVNDSNCNKIATLEEETESFIFEQFVECASHNSLLNQTRSKYIHRAFGMMSISFVPLLISCCTFVAFDLDTSSPRKAFSIQNKSIDSIYDELLKQTKLQKDRMNETN
jgi:hypothetical protein